MGREGSGEGRPDDGFLDAKAGRTAARVLAPPRLAGREQSAGCGR